MIKQPTTFQDHLKRIEWTSYALLPIPLLTDIIERGRFPRTTRELVTEITVGALILGFIQILRAARRRIQRMMEARQTLTEMIVHDLKNPLGSIMASLSCVAERTAAPEEEKRLLAVALKGCHAQSELINQLLDVQRLESKTFPLTRKRIAVEKLLDECVEEWSGPAVFRDVTLRRPPSGALPTIVEGDPMVLRRLLGNLLQNALKNTPAGGQVTLGCSQAKNGVCITVSDTGMGIPAGQEERLFRRYSRVEGNTRLPGSGLGLFFCKLAAEAHGGAISLDSQKDRGTRVTVNLPMPPPYSRSLPPAPASRPAARFESPSPSQDDRLQTTAPRKGEFMMKFRAFRFQIFAAVVLAAVIPLWVASADSPAERTATAIENDIKADPGNADLWTHLGFAYRKLDKLDKAAWAFEKAVALDPKNQESFYMLGLIYEKQNKTPEALNAWKQYLAIVTDPEKKDVAQKHIHHLNP